MSTSELLIQEIEERQGVLRDMSRHLTELESQLSLIFAASPDIILFIQMDGKIIKASQAVWRILGYNREDLVGNYIWDYIHPEDIEDTKRIRERLVEDRFLYFNEHDYFINRWRKKDGSYAKLSWRFSIYDADESQTIGFATDVTHLGVENPFNIYLLARALKLAQDGIVITDYTLQDNPIIYVNNSFCNNSGYSEEELIGQNCRILQSESRDQEALKTIRSAVENGEGCEVLLKNARKNNTPFFNHLLITPIIQDGQVTHYIGISRDLTELVANGTYTWDKNSPRGFGKKPDAID